MKTAGFTKFNPMNRKQKGTFGPRLSKIIIMVEGFEIGAIMIIIDRLVKLAVICAIFFTIYDVIEFGQITWVSRLMIFLGI